jgi:CBS domain-containing protein
MGYLLGRLSRGASQTEGSAQAPTGTPARPVTNEEEDAMPGKRVGDVMMPEVRSVTRDTSVQHAARLMREADVGSLPVVDGERVVGVVTDRDIAVRVVGDGKGPDTPVGDVATQEVVSVGPEQDLDEALRLMAQHQVRRLPVVEQDGRLVGIFAQADAAMEAEPARVGEMVEEISEPPQTH